MTAVHRLLAALAIGVMHFVLTLFLGPGIHCAEARGCAAMEWVQPPSTDVFALPLSAARETLAPWLADKSFLYYSVANSLALVLLIFLCFWGWSLAPSMLARIRRRHGSRGA